MLCDKTGKPLSIEVFKGNTQDPATVASQIKKVAQRFGGGEITFVGDRGMVKKQQITDLTEQGFHYITAITKPQIEKLVNQGVIEMTLFDTQLVEVQTNEGIRYIIRRNPERADEIQQSRSSKLSSLRQVVEKQNQYLSEHSRASTEVAQRKVNERCEKLRINKWVSVNSDDREIILEIDQEALTELEKLDGCYVLKTDLDTNKASKKVIHDRYKDLAHVEWAFRTSKTVQLEMRPVNVRLATRTRGHVFFVMLAYRIVQELAKRWKNINLTVAEGVAELTTLCATEMIVDGKPVCNKIPEPRESVKELLKAAKVRLPEILPYRGVHVATHKQLTENRISD